MFQDILQKRKLFTIFSLALKLHQKIISLNGISNNLKVDIIADKGLNKLKESH